MATNPPEPKVTLQLHDVKTGTEHSECPDDLVHVSHAIQLAEDMAKAEYRPFSRSMLRLYGCLAIAYLCGCLNGYDGSLMGGLNAMTTYQEYFHM